MPTKITYSTGKSATYIYDATGKKLRVSYKASASATAVPTDYCGNMIYENGVLKQILVDGGYIAFSGPAHYYYYYLKDHLGNNRVVVSPSGAPLQVNHYYPFGGLFGESTGNSLQRFRFNGKEFDRTHGLDWYDYGARHMTPDVGRFTTIDPKAEKDYATSPYAYCGNNPLIRVDKDGKIWDTIWDVGNLMYDVGSAVINHIDGDHENAKENWKDAGYDLLSAIVPGFPAGSTKIIKGTKAFEKAAGKDVINSTVNKSLASKNRTESLSKGIPESELGPSGLPKIHNVKKATTKKAKDAARNAKRANTRPIKHSSDKGQKSHYHSTRDGEKLKGKDNIHYVDNSSKINQ